MTFPRGFAQTIAETHKDFILEEMELLKINRSNGTDLIIHYSTNEHNCKFIHIKSSMKEVFTNLKIAIFSRSQTQRKVEINIPAIGMDLRVVLRNMSKNKFSNFFRRTPYFSSFGNINIIHKISQKSINVKPCRKALDFCKKNEFQLHSIYYLSINV